MNGYRLEADRTITAQRVDSETFIGGHPKLPADDALPICSLCGALQSFFLQVAFPHGHYWDGLSMAVFACTSCVDENYLIPEMLQARLYLAVIPDGFLDTYQRNFRLLVFETGSGVVRRDYSERVRFQALRVVEAEAPEEGHSIRLGGASEWILEDESPESYQGVPMFFLLQIPPDFHFGLVPGAPRQIELSLAGTPEESPNDYYLLFNGNAIYLFGTRSGLEPKIYVITQID